jgi:formamidopyrimidine-DNA glycosylase
MDHLMLRVEVLIEPNATGEPDGIELEFGRRDGGAVCVSDRGFGQGYRFMKLFGADRASRRWELALFDRRPRACDEIAGARIRPTRTTTCAGSFSERPAAPQRTNVMPELPDVELYKRHLDATSMGRAIASVTVGDPRILHGFAARAFAGRVKGSRIGTSLRHGKHLLVDLGAPGWLALHFGMNGSLKHFADPEPDPPYDRVRFDLGDGHHLAYVNPRLIGRVAIVAEPASFIASEGLGVDALDPALNAAAFARILVGRRGAIKAVLMDQSVIAGIGNIYSDEILFQAGIHPRTSAADLTSADTKNLFSTMRRVLRTAIERGAGSEQFLDRLPSNFLIPRRRRGGTCPRCGGPLAVGKASGRSGYFCPSCQPPRQR